MISFKRTKRRNYRHPGEKYMAIGIAGMFGLLLVFMLTAFSAKSHLEHQLDETREMMAASIQSDMTIVLRNSENLSRKSTTLVSEALPAIRRHMYAANEMNDILVETFGEDYSMIDQAQYESFESIINRYEQLLATGQSTAQTAEQLTECMEQFRIALSNRFTADGALLPKTASTASRQP